MKDVVARLGDRGITEIESPLSVERPREHRLQGRPLGRRELHAARHRRARRDARRPSRSPPSPPPRRRHPGVRVEQFGDASAAKAIAAQDAQGRQEGRAHLLRADADHPAGRVRRARRRRRAARARRHRRGGHDRPARPGQPALRAARRRRRSSSCIIGLAVGVDYAMFYSRRMMEERDGGHSAEAALEIAAATSGRAVLISGLTVMTAMAGMFLAGNPIFVGFGIGTMLVVAVAVLGSMTFLPAMLSFLGREELAREGPRALRHQAPPPGQGRVARVGRDPHPRPQAPASSRRCSPAACSSRSPSPRSACSSRTPASTATRAASRSSRPTTASRPRSPAAPSRP